LGLLSETSQQVKIKSFNQNSGVRIGEFRIVSVLSLADVTYFYIRE